MCTVRAGRSACTFRCSPTQPVLDCWSSNQQRRRQPDRTERREGFGRAFRASLFGLPLREDTDAMPCRTTHTGVHGSCTQTLSLAEAARVTITTGFTRVSTHCWMLDRPSRGARDRALYCGSTCMSTTSTPDRSRQTKVLSINRTLRLSLLFSVNASVRMAVKFSPS